MSYATLIITYDFVFPSNCKTFCFIHNYLVYCTHTYNNDTSYKICCKKSTLFELEFPAFSTISRQAVYISFLYYLVVMQKLLLCSIIKSSNYWKKGGKGGKGRSVLCIRGSSVSPSLCLIPNWCFFWFAYKFKNLLLSLFRLTGSKVWKIRPECVFFILTRIFV